MATSQALSKLADDRLCNLAKTLTRNKASLHKLSPKNRASRKQLLFGCQPLGNAID
jgi:hypothetical protein